MILGIILCQQRQVKPIMVRSMLRKKNKVNIQACAIASVIQIAVCKAKSMKKKQSNRRKKGWIDLEGIRKRRTYN